MMKKIYSFIFLMLTGYVLCAYPISPRPLRKLVAESQYIVYADVVDVNAVSDTDIWSDHKASLVIRKIYQGEFIQDTIEVHFRPTMICPAPARYKTGTSVLAFLYKVDSLNFYETQALSYGAKEMTTHEELMAYEARIREMQQINTIKDSIDRNTKTKDWLVTCAIDPYTRWEGVYELSPQSDFMSNYDYNKDKTVELQTLSESQIVMLRQALLKTESFSYADMGMVDLVVKKSDPELLVFLTDKLKKADLESMWFNEELMERIAKISGREDLKKVLKKIDNVDYDDKRYEEKVIEYSKEFIVLL